MKISVVFISLLVLSSFLHEVQGIRLGKASISERHDQKLDQDKSNDLMKKVEVGVKNEAVVCRGVRCSGTKQTRFSRAVNKKEPHHWLPTIHEDYYGPKNHSPRHH
nr:PREDICTED: uncharacterized protein LOC108213994 [Daucus carota subsp. sativus]